MPWDVMCHDLERKHASIVSQFQSIETLQSPPISMLILPIFMPVLLLIAADAVEVIDPIAIPVDVLLMVIPVMLSIMVDY